MLDDDSCINLHSEVDTSQCLVDRDSDDEDDEDEDEDEDECF